MQQYVKTIISQSLHCFFNVLSSVLLVLPNLFFLSIYISATTVFINGQLSNYQCMKKGIRLLTYARKAPPLTQIEKKHGACLRQKIVQQSIKTFSLRQGLDHTQQRNSFAFTHIIIKVLYQGNVCNNSIVYIFEPQVLSSKAIAKTDGSFTFLAIALEVWTKFLAYGCRDFAG